KSSLIQRPWFVNYIIAIFVKWLSAGAGLRSEIRCDPVDFPVAVARRFGAARAVDFLGGVLALVRRLGAAHGAACRRFSERTCGGWREWWSLWRRRVSWHCSRLGVAVPVLQGLCRA